MTTRRSFLATVASVVAGLLLPASVWPRAKVRSVPGYTGVGGEGVTASGEKFSYGFHHAYLSRNGDRIRVRSGGWVAMNEGSKAILDHENLADVLRSGEPLHDCFVPCLPPLYPGWKRVNVRTWADDGGHTNRWVVEDVEMKGPLFNLGVSFMKRGARDVEE